MIRIRPAAFFAAAIVAVLAACEDKPSAAAASADTATATDAAVSSDSGSGDAAATDTAAQAGETKADAAAPDATTVDTTSTDAAPVDAAAEVAVADVAADTAAADAGAEVAPGNPCVVAGGTVETQTCCKSTGDFPNLCAIGACGCSPDNSKATLTCKCPDGKCFDGKDCVKQ